MRLASLILFLTASLEAATILPGSWIELSHEGEYGEYFIEDEDGFFVGGSLSFPGTRLGGNPDPDGTVDPWMIAIGFDTYVAEISSPWHYKQFVHWDSESYAGFEIFADPFPMVDISGPFTFDGFVEDDWGARYEFSGQGTVYLRIASGSANDYVSGARYEFEAVASVPEPSTWLLLTLGLAAACWAGKESS